MSSAARKRIEALLDENSFVELGALVTSRNTDFNLTAEATPSDGVVTGHGLIDGNLVFVFAQDKDVLGGSIGEMHAKKINSLYDMALSVGAPVIGLYDSTGVRLQESADALEAIGSLIKKASQASGAVLQIAAVFGSLGGGMAALSGLSDFVFMEKSAKLFINPVDTIDGLKEKEDTSSADFRYAVSGNADVIGSEDEVLSSIRSLIPILPGSGSEDGAHYECTDDLNRAAEGIAAGSDAFSIAKEISDAHLVFEAKGGYAKEMTTALIALNGSTVGVVGNNSKDLERSVLTAEAVEKAAEFIRFCDAFEIPVLTVTDVEGFETSRCAERRLIRALGALTASYAAATVPKITLISGKAFSSAYLFMNSKSIGADLVYAYADASYGIMDANLAAKIISADDASGISATAEKFASEANGIENAARRGYVDRILNPADTRKYIIDGFEMLYTKSAFNAEKKHASR